MGSDYIRPAADQYGGSQGMSNPKSQRTKPTMQTSGGAMGGAPHHMAEPPNSKQRAVTQTDNSADNLKFDEIVLESNEIDLADL